MLDSYDPEVNYERYRLQKQLDDLENQNHKKFGDQIGKVISIGVLILLFISWIGR